MSAAEPTRATTSLRTARRMLRRVFVRMSPRISSRSRSRSTSTVAVGAVSTLLSAVATPPERRDDVLAARRRLDLQVQHQLGARHRLEPVEDEVQHAGTGAVGDHRAAWHEPDGAEAADPLEEELQPADELAARDRLDAHGPPADRSLHLGPPRRLDVVASGGARDERVPGGFEPPMGADRHLHSKAIRPSSPAPSMGHGRVVRVGAVLLPPLPPARHVPWQRVPDAVLAHHVGEKAVVQLQPVLLEQVVRVHQQVHEPVVGRDPVALTLPERVRVVAQDLPDRVVLGEGDRQLDHVAEEVRQDRAAAAGLRLERVGCPGKSRRRGSRAPASSRRSGAWQASGSRPRPTRPGSDGSSAGRPRNAARSRNSIPSWWMPWRPTSQPASRSVGKAQSGIS